jgi:hypothetical protein
MPKNASFDPISVARYIREAQPTLADRKDDPSASEHSRIDAVKWLIKYNHHNRGLDSGADNLVDDFFVQEANRIGSTPNPARAFEHFLNGRVPRGRPRKADPESFGTVDMVNARLASNPVPTIDQACKAVADELGQQFAAVKKLYYKRRGEADKYKEIIEREDRAARAEVEMAELEYKSRRSALKAWDAMSDDAKQAYLSKQSKSGVSSIENTLKRARTEAQEETRTEANESDRKSEGISGD